MNKVKGNIKINIVDPPGFGPTRSETIKDLAILTGAKVINEELGDDLDLIDIDCLGKVEKAVTHNKNNVITTYDEISSSISSGTSVLIFTPLPLLFNITISDRILRAICSGVCALRSSPVGA